MLLNYKFRVCSSKANMQGFAQLLPRRKGNDWDCSLLFYELIPNFLVILCHELGELKSLTSIHVSTYYLSQVLESFYHVNITMS